MKNIKHMSLDELKARAEYLEHFSYDACILAESLLELAGRSEDTEGSLKYIKDVAGDVAHLEAHIYGGVYTFRATAQGRYRVVCPTNVSFV